MNNSVRNSCDHTNSANNFYKYSGNTNNTALNTLNQFSHYNNINNNSFNKLTMTVQNGPMYHNNHVQSKHGRSYRHSVDMCTNL